MPAIVFSGDILTAFDSTDHNTIHKANKETNKPIKTQLATMKDYYEKRANIIINNEHSTPTFDFTHAGLQGATRTPSDVYNVMQHTLQPVTNVWNAQGTGYRLKKRDKPLYLGRQHIPNSKKSN